jgi:hypothetical protein
MWAWLQALATALRASRPAPSITAGFEVLVQEVIAAITTSPSVSSLRRRGCGSSRGCRQVLGCGWRRLEAVVGLHRRSANRLAEIRLHVAPADAVLRALGAGQRGLRRGHVQLQTRVVDRRHRGHATGPAPWRRPRPARSAPRCGRTGAGSRASSASIGKMPQVAPYSGAMLAMVARSASGSVLQAVAEELDELADHAVLAQHLGDGQHQVGGGGALGQLAGQLEADHLRDQHRRPAGRASPPRPRCRPRPSPARRCR